ncbi:MAG: hypothetical protein WCP97_08080 [bacterium]
MTKIKGQKRIIIFAGVSLIMFSFIWLSYSLKTATQGKEKMQPRITISLRSDDSLVGTIEIKNATIKDTIYSQETNSELVAFIANNKDRWAKEKFSIPWGGQTDSGALYDGKITTTITDEKHIIGIWMELEEVKQKTFSMKYIFHLQGI